MQTKFNVQFTNGIRGASAYEVALRNGFRGTEQEWLQSLKAVQAQADWSQTDANAADYIKNKPELLKGDKGDKGDTGAQGIQGEKGADGYTPVKGTDYFTEADKAEIINEISAGGGSSGGEKEWTKSVYLKTTEDLTYINITEDDNGNPLSFDEALVIFTTAKASTAATSGNYVMSVYPQWKSSFNGFGVYGLHLNADVYSVGIRFKKADDLIIAELLTFTRVADSLSQLPFDSYVGKTRGGIPANNNNNRNISYIFSRYDYTNDGNGYVLQDDLFDSNNKMKAITIGTDLASSVQIGAGSILEVWTR